MPLRLHSVLTKVLIANIVLISSLVTVSGVGSVPASAASPSVTVSSASQIASDQNNDGGVVASACPSSSMCLGVGTGSTSQGFWTEGTFSGATMTWSSEVAIAPDSSGSSYLHGISCPSSTTCIAVGANDSGEGIFAVGTLSASTWTFSAATSITSDSSGSGELYGISCPTSTTCIATGYDNNDQGIVSVGTLTSGVWNFSIPTPVDPDVSGYSYFQGISCPTSTTCIATGYDDDSEGITSIGSLSGGVWTFATATSVTSDASGGSYFYNISCPDSTTCIAIGQDNDSQSVTSVGVLSGGVWTFATATMIPSDASGYDFFVNISCPTSTTCIAVGSDNDSAGITSIGTLSGTTWAFATPTQLVPDNTLSSYPQAIACPTPTSCVTTGSDDNNLGISSTGTLSGSAWVFSPVITVQSAPNGNGELSAVACPSTTVCIAVAYDDSFNEGAFTVGTLSGVTWTWTAEVAIAPDSSGVTYLNAISCPTSTTCIATGSDGNGRAVFSVATLNAGTWSFAMPSRVTPDSSGSGYFSASSCPTTTTCIATGGDRFGDEMFSVGTYSGGAWSFAQSVMVNSGLPGDIYIMGISCPTSTTCVAAGRLAGNQPITSIGTLSGGTWTFAAPTESASDTSGHDSFFAIACPTSTTCIAVGQNGNGQSITSVGISNGGIWTFPTPSIVTPDSSGSGGLYTIACPTSTTCIAGGEDHISQPIIAIGTSSGGAWSFTASTPTTPDTDGSGFFQGVACASPTSCVYVGGDRTERGMFASVSIPPTNPSAPNGLVVSETSGLISATWTPSALATGYTCTLLAGYSIPTTFVKSVAVPSCSFTIDSSLVFGISVVATNGSGVSPAIYQLGKAVQSGPSTSGGTTTTVNSSRFSVYCTRKGQKPRYFSRDVNSCPRGWTP